MRARWLTVPLLLSLVSFAPAVHAEDGEGKSPKKSEASSKKKDKGDKEAKADADGVRRDPKGITGISPLYEAVNKGDAAYGAKDWDKAIEAYKAAIDKEPGRAIGHYRLGEAQLAAGKLDDAEQSWRAAAKAAGDVEPQWHAKALLLLADLKERQGKWEDAANGWKEYASYVGGHPKANGYPSTPTERQKAIETRNDVAAKAAKVKERIQQRDQEVQQQAATPAKK